MRIHKSFIWLLAVIATMATLPAVPAGENNKLATVVVKVPKGAKVIVKGVTDETEMKVDNTECRFSSTESDTLEFGSAYTIRVKYTTEGKDYLETRQVLVFPGKTTDWDVLDIAAPNKKLRTYAYWNNINIINQEWFPKLLELVLTIPKLPDEKIHSRKEQVLMLGAVLRHRDLIASHCRSLVTVLDGLPTRGIDEDAVSLIQDTSEVFTRQADLYKRHNEEDEKALSALRKNLAAKHKKTRAILSARYDIELPVIGLCE